MKLFGREPALWLGLVGAVVAVLVSLNLEFLSAGQGAALVALITAVAMAITTRPVAPALFTGILTAGVALFAEYGLHTGDATVAGLTGLVLAAFAFITRSQVAPQETTVSSP